MRQGEILSLTWDNVDLDRRVAHLPMTKNGDSRDIPLSQLATETLRSLASERSGDRVMETTKSAVEQAWGQAIYGLVRVFLTFAIMTFGTRQ